MFRSSIFRGTHIGQILKATSHFTSTGEPLFAPPKSIRFRPVKLSKSLEETSIRTDRSGSQARADEETFDGRVLIEPSVSVNIGDKFCFDGQEFIVSEVFPRYTAMDGLLSHYQVDLRL